MFQYLPRLPIQKTTFDGTQPMMKDDLKWKKPFPERWSLMNETPKWKLSLIKDNFFCWQSRPRHSYKLGHSPHILDLSGDQNAPVFCPSTSPNDVQYPLCGENFLSDTTPGNHTALCNVLSKVCVMMLCNTVLCNFALLHSEVLLWYKKSVVLLSYVTQCSVIMLCNIVQCYYAL